MTNPNDAALIINALDKAAEIAEKYHNFLASLAKSQANGPAPQPVPAPVPQPVPAPQPVAPTGLIAALAALVKAIFGKKEA